MTGQSTTFDNNSSRFSGLISLEVEFPYWTPGKKEPCAVPCDYGNSNAKSFASRFSRLSPFQSAKRSCATVNYDYSNYLLTSIGLTKLTPWGRLKLGESA